jgi:aryl-alcohol dehydrogenase-like predicted oxidoreductase
MSEMTYRPLGDSGLMVSAVGIGCNAFGRRVGADGVRDVLAGARDAGVTLLDTADAYGDPPGASEELLGEALVGQRDEFVVATKFGMGMRGANGPTTASAVPGRTSAGRSRAACGGCAPTTSTSTSCTSPTTSRRSRRRCRP